MADLFTHASVAVLARLTQSRPVWVATFVAGTCLPDIARVPSMVLIQARWRVPDIPEALCYVWAPMHLPVGIVLVSYLVSLVFHEAQRRTAFKHLVGGGLLHLLVDLFQSHFGLGYLLFFPLSEWDFEFGLIGSEDTVRLVPFLVPITTVLAVWRWRT
ncbi:MAG: hypothetical protein EXR71_19080 [Myxococcales bacterium]|nr:hypothetical protein [Myxococcales bacterium]